MAPGARLVLARGVGLSGTVMCAARASKWVKEPIFGSGAMVFDNDFSCSHGEWEWVDSPGVVHGNRAAVRIGRGAFIGARAIILKGRERR